MDETTDFSFHKWMGKSTKELIHVHGAKTEVGKTVLSNGLPKYTGKK